jgi:hypothetical protein
MSVVYYDNYKDDLEGGPGSSVFNKDQQQI